MKATDFWDALFSNAAEIITAASQSPLGIFALSIIVLALIAVYFFRHENVKAKILIFIILVIGLAAYVVSIKKTTTESISAPRITLLPNVNCQFGWIYLGKHKNEKDVKNWITVNYRQAEDKNQKFLPELGDSLKLNRTLSILDANYKSQRPGANQQCSMDPPTEYRPEREVEFKIGEVDSGYVTSVNQIAILPRIKNPLILYYWARVQIK